MAPEAKNRSATGSEDGTSRRLLLLLALALVLFGTYFFLVGVPSPGAGEGGNPEEAAGPSPGEGEHEHEGDPDPLKDLGGPGEAPEGGEAAEGSTTAEGGSANTEGDTGEPVEGQPVAREQPGGDQNGEDEEVPRAEPSHGDDHLPSPDPLGRREDGRDDGEVSGQRLSASNYVTYAFGYTGKNADDYLSKVKSAVLEDDFYASPGGGYVEQTADRMQQAPNGVQSAAILKNFQILGGENDEYQALLTFEVADAYGSTGLEGEVTRYQQEVRLAEWRRNYWKVKRAGPVQVTGR